MGAINVEGLLSPISPDAPCGEDLGYDAAFGDLERTAAGKPEQRMGDKVVEGEEPDWREVKKQAVEILSRTKDLRVAIYLTTALLHTDKFVGFSDGLSLVRGFIDQFWEAVHPCLDPEDDNDPTLRVNTIATLCDPQSTLRTLRTIPLVSSRTIGRFSIRDIQVAAGELPAAAGETPPASSVIEAAFTDCDLEELSATGAALKQSVELVQAIESSVTAKVGVSNAPNLEELVRLLEACSNVVDAQLKRRGVGLEPVDSPVAGAAADGTPGAPAQRLTGEINSREDVIRALDKVCEYYERHEPSSPLPLLIRRAKRLASKSFLDIIRDLAPDALGQAQSIGGLDEAAPPSEEDSTSKSNKSKW